MPEPEHALLLLSAEAISPERHRLSIGAQRHKRRVVFKNMIGE
jgi:hypothetical protein